MKPFKFNLEPVLVLRLREEDAAKKSYGEALGFKARCQEALEQAMQDLEGLQYELVEKRMSLTRRDEQITFIHAIRQQRDFCNTVTQRLVRADQLVRVRMEAWMEARRKTEMLDRLKTKRREMHRLEAQRVEDRAIDEIVSARHGRLTRLETV